MAGVVPWVETASDAVTSGDAMATPASRAPTSWRSRVAACS